MFWIVLLRWIMLFLVLMRLLWAFLHLGWCQMWVCYIYSLLCWQIFLPVLFSLVILLGMNLYFVKGIFYINWDGHMVFVFKSIHIIYNLLIYVCCKIPESLEKKLTLSWWILIYASICFASALLRILTSWSVIILGCSLLSFFLCLSQVWASE